MLNIFLNQKSHKLIFKNIELLYVSNTMAELDLTKNFAIVTMGVDANQKPIYGVAFAALRNNTDLFLVATTNNGNSISILEIHKDVLSFIHPCQWENLLKNENIVKAYQSAYYSTPEDWPCGYVRALFSETPEVEVN